jgi:hypothetical protein
MESKLQEDLNQIKTWSSQWRMKLSSEKTEYCIFFRDKKDKDTLSYAFSKSINMAAVDFDMLKPLKMS